MKLVRMLILGCMCCPCTYKNCSPVVQSSSPVQCFSPVNSDTRVYVCVYTCTVLCTKRLESAPFNSLEITLITVILRTSRDSCVVKV